MENKEIRTYVDKDGFVVGFAYIDKATGEIVEQHMLIEVRSSNE